MGTPVVFDCQSNSWACKTFVDFHSSNLFSPAIDPARQPACVSWLSFDPPVLLHTHKYNVHYLLYLPKCSSVLLNTQTVATDQSKNH